MKKKILSTLLAMTMTFGCTIPAAAISIYAPVEDDDESSYEMSENIPSIGSDASNASVGEDITQGKYTEYYPEDDSSSDKPFHTDVYATKASDFSVVIPKVVILSGSKNASGMILTLRKMYTYGGYWNRRFCILQRINIRCNSRQCNQYR